MGLAPLLNFKIYHLYLAFTEFAKIQNGTVIICGDELEKTVCERALKFTEINVNVYTPTFSSNDEESKKKAYKSLNSGVMITEHTGIRGMELRNVIVIL